MNNKRKKNNAKSTLIAILVVVAIGLSSLTYFFLNPEVLNARSVSDSKIVDLPRISTKVMSEDGESHSVDASISLEFTEDTQGLSSSRLTSLVKDAVSSLEYEKMTEPGNINYIKDEVAKKLDGYVTEDQLVDVYITEIQAGDYRVSGSAPPQSTEIDSRNDVAGRLFGNVLGK